MAQGLILKNEMKVIEIVKWMKQKRFNDFISWMEFKEKSLMKLNLTISSS